MAIPTFLEQLLTAVGPSGHETGPAAVWRKECEGFADEVGGDHVGSSFARVKGKGGGRTLAIVGHIDEIGVHVSHIDDNGYLRFGEVGGWDPLVLVGQRVTLTTRAGPVRGVIGRKPTHQPGIELGQITKHEMDSGPVIARGTSLHPLVFELLHEAGEAEEIPFTVESLGRGTGTDADAIHLSRAGIPTGLVSVPSRYMHSPVELVSLNDIEAAAKLIAAFAQRLAPDVSFAR